MEINLKEYYADRAQSLAKEIAGLKQKNRSFVAGQIIFFLAFVVFVVLYTTTAGGRLLLVMAALSVIAYFIVRRFDVLNGEKIATQNSLLQVYQNEMAYQEGDYSAFYDGREYVDPQHPFTFDLDIFGSQSLFQRINRTVTTGGSRRLASLLSTEHESAQGEIERITLQKEAIDELAEM